jgi:hypothetical protein
LASLCFAYFDSIVFLVVFWRIINVENARQINIYTLNKEKRQLDLNEEERIAKDRFRSIMLSNSTEANPLQEISVMDLDMVRDSSSSYCDELGETILLSLAQQKKPESARILSSVLDENPRYGSSKSTELNLD